MQRFIVDTIPYFPKCLDADNALKQYLEKNPHPKYRLANATWIDGRWIVTWELMP